MVLSFLYGLKRINRYLISGVLVGIVGFLYYANFRQAPIYLDYNPLFNLFRFTDEAIQLPRYVDEWIPSFLHVIGMSLFTFGLLLAFTSVHQTQIKTKSHFHISIPIFWLVIDLLFEFGQASEGSMLFAAGNFEWMDVTALVAATIVSIILLAPAKQLAVFHKNPCYILSDFKAILSEKVAIALTLLVGSYTMLGSYVVQQCQYPDGYVGECGVTPIYLSESRIRRDDQIFVAPDSELANLQLLTQEFYGIENAGKLYVYGDLLFINERFKGAYVFDNSDPSEPKYLAYISVLGNQDIVVYNDILYLDSFMDIVSINLRVFVDALNSSELADLPNIYMFRNRDANEVPNSEDMRQFLPAGSYFNQSTYVSSSMLVGYRALNGVVHYFWDIEI